METQIENKRELMLRAINNQEIDRVPVGFWHHFVLGKDQFSAVGDQDLQDRIYEGHVNYFKTVNPDMMKLMNEGFMGYPPIMMNSLSTAEDLKHIRCIGPNNPWMDEQVKHVNRMVDAFGDKVLVFYNMFAPLQSIRIRFDFLDGEYDKFVYLAEHFPKELHDAGMEIQKDFVTLTERLFKETKLDGIYYCVQNVQSKLYNAKYYKELIEPTEIEVLNTANRLRENNILHICGYAHHTNNLHMYENYRAKIYNWAVHTEGISLQEGKKFFKDACVLGGFDNNPGTLIDKGSKDEVRAYVKKMIQENGYRGFILGADCSIPNDIDDERIRWISDAVNEFRK
jgi:uroporphyrinogen decarboxylase